MWQEDIAVVCCCRWVPCRLMCAVHQRPQQKAARSCKHTKKRKQGKGQRTADTGHRILAVNHHKNEREKQANEIIIGLGLAQSNERENGSLKTKIWQGAEKSSWAHTTNVMWCDHLWGEHFVEPPQLQPWVNYEVQANCIPSLRSFFATIIIIFFFVFAAALMELPGGTSCPPRSCLTNSFGHTPLFMQAEIHYFSMHAANYAMNSCAPSSFWICTKFAHFFLLELLYWQRIKFNWHCDRISSQRINIPNWIEGPSNLCFKYMRNFGLTAGLDVLTIIFVIKKKPTDKQPNDWNAN